MILFETIKPELFAILTTEPAFSTGVYRDEWASCLKGKKKSLKTVQGRVIISFWKGKALGMPVFAGCVCGAAGTTEPRGLQGDVQVLTLQVRDACSPSLHAMVQEVFFAVPRAAGLPSSPARHPLCTLHVL